MVAVCDRFIVRGVPFNPNFRIKKERISPFLRRDAFGDAVIVPIFYNRGKGAKIILQFVDDSTRNFFIKPPF